MFGRGMKLLQAVPWNPHENSSEGRDNALSRQSEVGVIISQSFGSTPHTGQCCRRWDVQLRYGVIRAAPLLSVAIRLQEVVQIYPGQGTSTRQTWPLSLNSFPGDDWHIHRNSFDEFCCLHSAIKLEPNWYWIFGALLTQIFWSKIYDVENMTVSHWCTSGN